MQNSGDIARFKMYVDEGIQLTKEGKLDSAIEKFCEALQLEPNSISVLNYLAGIYEIKKEFAQSITYYKQVIQLQPDKGITYARLAKVMMAQKNIQEAIAVYQQATSLQLKLPAWGYAGLGNALHLNRQLDEAIAAYQQAIELKSDNHSFYIELSRLYYQQGQIDRASESLQQAIKLKPDLPFQIYQDLEELLRLQGRKKEATKWLKSAPLDRDGATYLSIWSALNQTNLESWNQESSTYPKKINQQKAKKYFNQTSQYKTINLTKLKKKDRRLIESLGWSLTYLESNRSGLISKEAISQEEYDSHLAQLQRKERREYIRLSAATQFQLSMVEDGFIQAICPSTGRNLTSNHSVYWSPRLCFCWYRFVGEEVFYLITGDHWREKLALYFPSSEVIVTLVSSQTIKAEDINLFKAYAVNDWERIKSCTISSDKKEKVTIIWFRHFAHHLWNELSAIYKLYETNLLDKVDKFLVVNEPLGCINEVFPEIPSEKIKHITHKELQTEILENNYFNLNLGNAFIKEDLAKRVYQVSLHKCSPAFLAEVESAKKNHSLLFWVSIRLGSRTWVSQVEGIANIIKSLSENFPNLGVVVDGFSLPEDLEGFIDPKHKATIGKEKETVRQIRSLLPPEVKVYDTVGCWLHESIVWAEAIDLYLTHHGTIQHKVGWTANKPGVVHTNKKILKMSPSVRPGCWERENIVVPVYISEQHIIDLEDKVYTHHGKWDKKTSLYNYECDWRGVYEEVLKIALSIRDEKVKADLNLGNQLTKDEKETKTIESYQKESELNPDSIPTLSKLAEIYSNQKEYDQAFTSYLKIVSRRPKKPIFLQKLVRVSLDYSQLLLKNNDLEKAIATYQEFITQKLSKNNKTETKIDRICQIWGEVILKLSIRQGQWTLAITFFQEAIDNYPHQEWSYYYLGSILTKQDKLDEAIACYEKAVAIRPKFSLGLLSLGKLLLKTTRRDRAFKCGLKILENHGIFGGSELNKSLIQLLSAHSNPEKSKLALQQAIEQIEISDSKPDFKATTYSNIGMMLRNQGELDEAKDLYQKSIYYQLQESKPEFVSSYWEQGILQKPDFLVLGFAKCGTTAFYDYLCQHPQVLPAVKKEPMYLYHWLVKLKDFETRDWSLPSPEKDLYLAHFAPRPKGSHFITGEASTNNIFSGCEHVIHSWFPKIKLIVLLREPIRRTISYYEYRLKMGDQNCSLREVINSELEKLEKISNPAQTVPEMLKRKSWEEHIAMSLYVYPLERWMNIFPREQFLILTNEELAQYPAETMKQAFDFLELPEYNAIEYHPRNVRAYPQADANLLSRLSNFFQPHNQRLEELLGRKFNWNNDE